MMHSFSCNPPSNSSQYEGDLLVAIAALVTEGRIPGPSESGNTKSKDFHEGPHCNYITGVNRTHRCDIKNPLCTNFTRNRETVLKLLKKGVPLCVEVLFTCFCKELGNIETDNLDNAVLLEQWYFCTARNRGMSTVSFNLNQLISAIRSQLYFSQISAWLVTQDKASPITTKNLHYRLSGPDEVLAPLTFALTASKHEFPISDLGHGITLSVSFLSAPRIPTKPTFDCATCFSKKLATFDSDISYIKMELKHELVDDRMHTSCTIKGKHCCEDVEDDESLKVKTDESINTFCQRDNTGTHGQLFPRNVKKPKPNHNIEPPAFRIGYHYENSHANSFAKRTEENKSDFERNKWPHDRCHNLNDLKTVQDKGQLLLDAIVRSGQKNFNSNNIHCVDKRNWRKKSECDNIYCDMSESDKLFSHRERNNFNIYVDNNCDSNNSIRPTRNRQHVSNINQVNLTAKPTGAKKRITFGDDGPITEKHLAEIYNSYNTNGRVIPTVQDQANFRRNLGNTTSSAFHARTGLPLSSSPAPVRKGQTRFDFDSSLNSVSAIKSALFSSSFSTDEESESDGSIVSPCSPEIYTGPKRELCPVIYRRKGRPTSLLGTFEESVLNGRLEPVSTVHGFTAELGASGSFVPKHIVVPVTAFFYAFGDHDKVSTPYLAHISLGRKGYYVPKIGTVQVTLFNPLRTVVKMFVLPYDLSNMPPNSQTFIRQRTLYMPTDCKNEKLGLIPKWLRFVIHVRFMSSKSGKIYLHSDIRMIIIKKSDMDTATAHDIDMNYELRSFTHMPTNPKFSPRK